MYAPVDPRIRVRDALRELVQEHPTSWDRPSLFIVRNRLLDRTGSDARPLAELLLEALRRGWRDRLPPGAVDTPRWNALIAPFVLQWSAERFVQPEMARWAVEAWGYALRVIDASQITVAPPPKREPMSAMAARLNARAAVAGAHTTATATAVVQAARTAAGGFPAGRAAPARATAPARGATSGGPGVAGVGGRVAPRSAARGTLPPSASGSRPAGAYGGRARGHAPPVPAWVTKAMAGTLGAMALLVVGRVALFSTPIGAEPAPTMAQLAAAGEDPTTRSTRAVVGPNASAPNPLTAQAPAAPISPVAAALRAPVVTPDEATRLPATNAGAAVPAAAGQLVSPALTGGVAIVAPEKPGVPSITRNVLPTAADSARMIFVQPARRAAGESRPVLATTARVPITYDELRLRNGSVMRGRVDVVQAGSVIFRDMKTGLRYEIRKDDIDEIISEFGTPVRFRSASATDTKGAKGTPPGGVVRTRGVAGRYRVRYAAASAVGSPECTDVWRRPPNAEDIADVRHVPGADTLNVAFVGGDNFPSNIDGDGWFASTFRIVPDQARTMTALTTRLNGQFRADGTLQFAVNIVFFRRMRTGGDVTCNVTVNAVGQRE